MVVVLGLLGTVILLVVLGDLAVRQDAAHLVPLVVHVLLLVQHLLAQLALHGMAVLHGLLGIIAVGMVVLHGITVVGTVAVHALLGITVAGMAVVHVLLTMAVALAPHLAIHVHRLVRLAHRLVAHVMLKIAPVVLRMAREDLARDVTSHLFNGTKLYYKSLRF